ncbi:PREDICTED: uncharacterized protein LOC104811721 [Tarenaya hassleriana]|uniref:uncharacterized protein LOC104811721 n=1 Tax=Tarenaya hassleriana TaxID=28532 RepID=UPI00053C1C1A|nr:PREDICTED: uncharacterized protein LOC104811721 [Tarenaya hassleriana]
MVFNGAIVMSVAHFSAEVWQRLRRIPPPEQISSGDMLELVCCFPLRQLGRLASWFWTYLCVPPPDPFDYYDEDDEDDDRGYVNHGPSSSSSSYVGTYQTYYHLHLD